MRSNGAALPTPAKSFPGRSTRSRSAARGATCRPMTSSASAAYRYRPMTCPGFPTSPRSVGRATDGTRTSAFRRSKSNRRRSPAAMPSCESVTRRYGGAVGGPGRERRNVLRRLRPHTMPAVAGPRPGNNRASGLGERSLPALHALPQAAIVAAVRRSDRRGDFVCSPRSGPRRPMAAARARSGLSARRVARPSTGRPNP